MKKTQKKQGRCDQFHLLAALLARWRHPVASTNAVDLIYWAMRAVSYRCTATAIKMASKVVTFFRHCFICCSPGSRWGNRVSSRPIATSSGFESSPGHAASGNAVCVALAHCHDHQNGQQRNIILMPSSILSSTITVAKDHVMVH
jgi:hypothetical protein